MERDPSTNEPGPAMGEPRTDESDLPALPVTRAVTRAAIRVLMVEESARDAARIKHQLANAGMTIEVLRVHTRQALVSALRSFEADVVLTDCVLPDLNGLEAVKLVREFAPHVPVIVVSGMLADNIVVNLLDVGAHDYVLKDRLARLAPAVLRALSDVRRRRLRDEIEASLRSLRVRFQVRTEDAAA